MTVKCKMLITTNIVEGHDGGSSDGGDVFTLSVGRKEFVFGCVPLQSVMRGRLPWTDYITQLLFPSLTSLENINSKCLPSSLLLAEDRREMISSPAGSSLAPVVSSPFRRSTDPPLILLLLPHPLLPSPPSGPVEGC